MGYNAEPMRTDCDSVWYLGMGWAGPLYPVWYLGMGWAGPLYPVWHLGMGWAGPLYSMQYGNMIQ